MNEYRDDERSLFWPILALVVVVSLGVYFWSETREVRFAWKPAYTETVALHPGQTWGLRIHGGKVKYAITAAQPVSINVEGANCASKQQILSTESVCDIGRNATLSVTDERTAGQIVAEGILGVLTRSSAATEAIESNRMSVTLYDWQCVENCSQLGRR